MWIALIASFICLLAAVILFTPLFRNLPLFRPIALFFVFEGVWILANYLVTQIWPGNDAMQYIHYTGIIVFGGYLLLCLFYSRPKKNREEKAQKKKKRAKRSRGA
ncbi:MAG: hypothetical protein ACI4I4_07570 [Acutalibacteraceae bacterium]